MCNEGVMVIEGKCSAESKCTDENCRYCALVDGIEKCLVCKQDYALLIRHDRN